MNNEQETLPASAITLVTTFQKAFQSTVDSALLVADTGEKQQVIIGQSVMALAATLASISMSITGGEEIDFDILVKEISAPVKERMSWMQLSKGERAVKIAESRRTKQERDRAENDE